MGQADTDGRLTNPLARCRNGPHDGLGLRHQNDALTLLDGDGHGQAYAPTARRADGPEQVGTFVALAGRLARPLPHDSVLPADAIQRFFKRHRNTRETTPMWPTRTVPTS